jgi:transposase
MLRPDRRIEHVYLHRAPVDMRRQIDGLAMLAKEVIRQEPTCGALFVFINVTV